MPDDQSIPSELTNMPGARARQVWSSLKREIEGFSMTTAGRGRRYFDNGQVGDLEFFGSCVCADVYGRSSYTTTWYYEGGYWGCECTCPVEIECKHAYALALEVISWSLESAGEELPEGRFGHDTPSPTSAVRSDPSGARQRPGPGGFTSSSEALAALREAAIVTARAQALEYLVEGGALTGTHLRLEFRDELEDDDPDLRCWRIADSIASRNAEWVPVGLKPFLERHDLRTRILDRQRKDLAKDLFRWAHAKVHASKRSLRLVLDVLTTPFGAGLTVACTLRQTSARMDDAPRTIDQVRTLLTEVHNGKVVLDPEQHAALDWLVHGAVVSFEEQPRVSEAALRTIDRFAGSSLVTWSDDIDPALAAQAGITPGGPIAASPGPARLVPMCRDVGGDAVLGLAFQWINGNIRTLSEGLQVQAETDNYGDHSAFVIADGAISPIADKPPHLLVEQFESLGAVPIDRDVRAPLLRSLGARYPHLLRTLAEHTTTYPATAVVALDLRDDDWLQVRVYATAPDENWIPGEPLGEETVFELHPESGWSRAALREERDYSEIDADVRRADIENGRNPATAVATDSNRREADPEHAQPGDLPPEQTAGDNEHATRIAWDEAPDSADVQPVVDWLEVLNPGSGDKRRPGGRLCPWPDSSVGWWLHISRAGAAHFAEAWAVAPRESRFFGTDAVRRLLSRRHRATASIRVNASGVDWFEVSAEWQAEGMQLTEQDLETLRKAKSDFVRLPSGWVRRDTTGELDETASLIADLGVEVGGESSRLSLFELAGANPATLQALENLGGDQRTFDAIRALRERIKAFDGIPRVRKPRRFRGVLRPYQRDGLDFLTYAADLGLGAILADDMGLGKTIQALAWLQSQHDKDPGGGPALVVCPASVTDNWLREAAQFTPKLKVLTLDRGRERIAQLERVADCDIAITNYALLRRDIEHWREQPLRALILDEAQNVKNPDAATTRAVHTLDARFRLALTGTPLENRLLDLWSIVQCVNPGYLGTRSVFAQSYDQLDLPKHRRTLLAAKLRPILVRRTKAQVAPDLPDRIEESRRCEMTVGQRKLYLAELAKSRRLVAQLSEDASALKRNKISILAALTRLRQICCHPALVGGKKGLGSGKFDTLFEILEPLLAEGHKVLLFSQFVQNLKLLRTELHKRGMRDHMLTGSTTKRGAVIDAFSNDPEACVFLISLKAGGTGLNLTSASYVVLFDPWWNPAVEAQAIDRTHRIGQDRTVIAYRLITTGTIEEKILELQQRKRGLADDVLGEAGFARSLDGADLEYILEDP